MINVETHNKTIEELEKDYWTLPSIFPTELVKQVYSLRKKTLSDLTNNDLRILISQNVGLEYIIPIAIERLTINILEEAFYYPGDLLFALLKAKKEFWIKNETIRNQFINLLKKSKAIMRQQLSPDDETDKSIFETVDKFISSC